MSSAPLSKTPVPRANPRVAVVRRTQLVDSAPPEFVPAPPAVARTAWLKLLIDYPVAGFLFILLGPIILLAMLMVRITSRGPAIYTQERVGRDNRVFTIYKIRTMYHECESLTGPRWSLPGDPRITPLGKIFRALHIDELPQLINVLKGDMSLVGPRPERPEICRDLRKSITGYDRRHAVKPGITGFAQIHLPPDNSLRSVKNKIAYDRFYLLKSGLGMELYVLACTALKIMGLRRLYVRPPRNPAND